MLKFIFIITTAIIYTAPCIIVMMQRGYQILLTAITFESKLFLSTKSPALSPCPFDHNVRIIIFQPLIPTKRNKI